MPPFFDTLLLNFRYVCRLVAMVNLFFAQLVLYRIL